jgi:hypothetical protein
VLKVIHKTALNYGTRGKEIKVTAEKLKQNRELKKYFF